jgi:hypothetical protein
MKARLLLPAAALAAAGAFAQQADAPPQAAAATAAAFRCGGVGQDDQQRIQAEAASHDLLLTFAGASGEYLADIDVEIRRGGQLVLQGRCEGPLMLVDLPADGSYEVRATSAGREQRKTVRIGGQAARAIFTWPGS